MADFESILAETINICRTQSDEQICLFLDNDRVKDALDSNNCSLLWHAPTDILVHLLQFLNPNIKNNEGKIFLDYISQKDIDVFLDFLERGTFSIPLDPNLATFNTSGVGNNIKKVYRSITFDEWALEQILQFLKYSGPNFSQKINANLPFDNGDTLLHAFIFNDEYNDIVKQILLLKPNPHIKNDEGVTALHVADRSFATKNKIVLKKYMDEYKSETIAAAPSQTVRKSWRDIVASS